VRCDKITAYALQFYDKFVYLRYVHFDLCVDANRLVFNTRNMLYVWITNDCDGLKIITNQMLRTTNTRALFCWKTCAGRFLFFFFYIIHVEKRLKKYWTPIETDSRTLSTECRDISCLFETNRSTDDRYVTSSSVFFSIIWFSKIKTVVVRSCDDDETSVFELRSRPAGSRNVNGATTTNARVRRS